MVWAGLIVVSAVFLDALLVFVTVVCAGLFRSCAPLLASFAGF